MQRRNECAKYQTIISDYSKTAATTFETKWQKPQHMPRLLLTESAPHKVVKSVLAYIEMMMNPKHCQTTLTSEDE